MINKTEDKEEPKNEGFIEIVPVNVQCHILIKDVDTGEIIVNKRG